MNASKFEYDDHDFRSLALEQAVHLLRQRVTPPAGILATDIIAVAKVFEAYIKGEKVNDG